jgi:hypothetical protein
LAAPSPGTSVANVARSASSTDGSRSAEDREIARRVAAVVSSRDGHHRLRSRAFLIDPVLTCVLEGQVEALKSQDEKREMQLIAMVEDVLGRRVVSHVRAVHPEQGVAAETFILDQPSEDRRAVREQQDRLRRELSRRSREQRYDEEG